MKKDFTFKKRKYGLLVHFVHGISCHSDGSLPQSINETVDGFDVQGFANNVEKMGVEYLIFTAWHWRAIPLYPSEVPRGKERRVVVQNTVGGSRTLVHSAGNEGLPCWPNG